MPLFKLGQSTLQEVPKSTFQRHGVLERQHLQAAIRDHPAVLGEDLLILAEEFEQWEDADRRIDLLAVDREGSLVVIELKRDEDAGHAELQAIRYAAMVAPMTFSDAVNARTAFLEARGDEAGSARAEEDILGFVTFRARQDVDEQPGLALSGTVRIILVAADFSKEISATVLWLREYGIDVRCVRLVPYTLDGQVLVHSEMILPLPEARDYMVRIAKRNEVARDAEETARATRVHYDLEVDGKPEPKGPFNRRRLFAQVIRRLVERGVSPNQLAELTGTRNLFHVAEGSPSEEELTTQIRERSPRDAYAVGRYDHQEEQLIRFQGKTYALFNQNSKGLLPLLEPEAQKFGMTWRESSAT